MHCFRSIIYAALVFAILGSVPQALAVDCNNNGVEDTLDITNATSLDCDVNGVPDECQPDTNTNGVIDACDNCGAALTDNNLNEFLGARQRTTREGKVLWFDEQNTVFFYDGTQATPLQPQVVGADDLGAIADFVFALGTGAAAGEYVAGWRRGTDFAWVWTNNGQPPRLVQVTNPYNAAQAMNPEGVAIADGCVFFAIQANVGGTLIKHVFKVDPATGAGTLLTGDFLNDAQNGGTGAEPVFFFASGCKGAWNWCHSLSGGSCTGATTDLQVYDGTSIKAIDNSAQPLAFERGRLLYSKEVAGVTQLFVYDTNLAAPTPVQITSFTATDKKILFAQTDGRHVAILLGDAANQNRQIDLLGGFALTDAATQPSDNPNLTRPIQLHRGQLLWKAQDTSIVYFDGANFGRVCNEGWLADGFLAQARKSSTTGADNEIWLASLTPPSDAQQPSPPLIVKAVASGNGQAALSWESILGATGYKVYFAQATGVNAANFASLPGGGSATAATNSTTISGLLGNAQYFFVVAAVEGTAEGPVSREATVTPCLDPALDSDTDGTPDCADGCVSDPNKTAPGACGCGVADTDTDTDGTPDCTDACPADPNKTAEGACGCGTPDTDTDADGTPDCTDGCPDDPGKIEPGLCGCGFSDADDNGDGAPDCTPTTGNGTPAPPACGAGACGAGTAAMAPLTVLGLMRMRSVRARTRRKVN